MASSISSEKKIAADILLSFIFRSSSALCAFLLVPITLNYLDKSLYGLWMTILAFINWAAVFDLGINNGLRTKLIYAFAQKDNDLAQREITTTYNIMLLFCLTTIAILLVVFQWINWNELFNYPQLQLGTVIVISLAFYVFKLFTDLINAVLLADQKTWLFNLIFFLSNILSLLAVVILQSLPVKQKLLILATLLTAIPLVISALSNVFLFSTTYRSIRPRFFKIHSNLAFSTISQGLRFFILQLSVLIIFSTDNIIIIRIFSASHVATYNICYKLFSIFTIVWTVILTPFWSAFGDAYHKKDFDWIKSRVHQLLCFWLLLNLGLLVTLCFVNRIYDLWIGHPTNIPFSLSVFTALFISIFSLSNIYVYFINGIGKLYIQLITSVATGLVNIPLAIFFAKNLDFGLSGIMAATCICLSVNPIVSFIQYRKLITGNAKGIWNR
jgi:O-antigen/teichoic acid export membrane protein